MDSRDETVRFLRTLFAAGYVFEIRALEAVTAEYQRPHAESGYFDYDHIPQAAEAISKLRSYSGAYVTLNPVNPALLGRANNRIAPARRDNSTADGDVLRRRWLPIDCDPVRPSGIASTDEEHEAALALAREIRDGLSSLGWPEPVMLDSGNGAQMLYRIDLPTDDNGLVKKCIEEIAKASTDAVKVDVTVFNAARIWRVAGTMNRKGDPLDDRPHRQARIVSVPKRIRAAGRTLMEALCGNTAAASATESAGGRTECPHDHPHDEDRPFDADRWISEHCPDIGTPKPWNGGRKWVFKVCPFNPAHSNGSAVLIQEASGAMAFRCHHNGCAGNNWQKLREMLEPGCYDREPQTEPLPLDWHALGAKAKPDGNLVIHEADPSMAKPQGNLEAMQAEQPKPEAFTPIEPFPEELYNVPGFVSDVMAFCLDTAPSPNRMTAFVGALALMAHLAGRKVQAPGGARTNPYLIVLAKSGYGKDHPRKVNRAILKKIGRSGEILDSVSSGQALEDRLLAKPLLLWQCDEFYALLKEIVNDTTGQKENLMKALLTFFTSANVDVEARAKVGCEAATINCPNLTLMGSCTPGNFYSCLDDSVLAHGIYSRMSVFPVPKIGDVNLPKDIDAVPERIVEKPLWDRVHEYLDDNASRERTDHTVVPSNISPLKGLLKCGHCGGPMMAYNRRKNGRVYTYYRCLRDSKRAERTCPVREVAAPVVDELVRRQLTAVLRSPQMLGALEEKSGVEAAGVLKTLDEGFWKEATSAECRRIVELLVAEAVLTTDRLVLELNTEGINSIMEEIKNESNQD